jgi:hypothetical protein
LDLEFGSWQLPSFIKSPLERDVRSPTRFCEQTRYRRHAALAVSAGYGTRDDLGTADVDDRDHLGNTQRASSAGLELNTFDGCGNTGDDRPGRDRGRRTILARRFAK